ATYPDPEGDPREAKAGIGPRARAAREALRATACRQEATRRGGSEGRRPRRFADDRVAATASTRPSGSPRKWPSVTHPGLARTQWAQSAAKLRSRGPDADPRALKPSDHHE